MRISKLTENDVVNWWLKKYHNTTLEVVFEKTPKLESRDFYASFKVTEEQHDEWREWLVKTLMKETRMSRKYIERGLWAVYLNTSPSVIDDKNLKSKDNK